jgi:hypothetical protein
METLVELQKKRWKKGKVQSAVFLSGANASVKHHDFRNSHSHYEYGTSRVSPMILVHKIQLSWMVYSDRMTNNLVIVMLLQIINTTN